MEDGVVQLGMRHGAPPRKVRRVVRKAVEKAVQVARLAPRLEEAKAKVSGRTCKQEAN